MPFSIDSINVNAPSYPSRAVEANPAMSGQMASRRWYCETRAAIGRVATAVLSAVSCEAAAAEIVLSFRLGMAEGLIVTRISAAAAILICRLGFQSAVLSVHEPALNFLSQSLDH
jgi:hypothetical protein